MLNKQDRNVEAIAHSKNQRQQIIDFLMIEAARRFVEEKQFWLAHQRTGEFDALLSTEWKRLDDLVANPCQIDKLHDFFGKTLRLPLFSPDHRKTQDVRKKPLRNLE